MQLRTSLALTACGSIAVVGIICTPLMAQGQQPAEETPSTTSTVVVTETAPAVTVTVTPTTSTTPPYIAKGPSSDAINKGAMNEERKEIFNDITTAIAVIGALLQFAVVLIPMVPGLQDQLKALKR